MSDNNSTNYNRSRKRSRSPYRQQNQGDDPQDVKRHRSRSPRPRKHEHSARKEKLPFRSRHLHKHDFESYKALFADYLDLQKEIYIEDLDDHEVRGRWKSFTGKWNRGELAEGWYDPERKESAEARASHQPREQKIVQTPQRVFERKQEAQGDDDDDDDDDDDGYGPLPPRDGSRAGPTIPSFQDLRDKREQAEDDRRAEKADLRIERRQDRQLQKERWEELAPRAAPGIRERQLEKKREVATSNRAFADAKEAGAEEVGDGDLMGDDGVDAYKAKKRAQERQKNERELRKEEILRAREAEREERLAEHRRKEEKTMEYLRSLAQQRFGGIS